MTRILNSIHLLLYRPHQIFVLCLIFASCSLLFSGNLLRLYQLGRDRGTLENQMLTLHSQVEELNSQLKAAKDPSFLERKAMDLYDLANEQDLVFVFADE